MAEVAPEILAERESLRDALEANPADPITHLKLAQLEARLWTQDHEAADLKQLLGHVETALSALPAERRPQVARFLLQLHQTGAGVAEPVRSGQFPHVLALMSNRPLPEDNGLRPPEVPASPEPAPKVAEAPVPAHEPPAARAEVAPEPEEPPAPAAPPSAAPMAASTSPAAGSSAPAGVIFKEVDVGNVTTDKLKVWLGEHRLEELASAYPLIDNFATSRLIVERISAARSPRALAALVHILAHEHDAKRRAAIKAKILGFEESALEAGLSYSPLDVKHKATVVELLAERKTGAGVAALRRALRDPDAHVREQALVGLGSLIKRGPEWIRELGRIVAEDRHPQVRLAAAKNLELIDSPEAFQELDRVVKGAEIDEAIRGVHRRLTEKFITSHTGERLAQHRARKEKAHKVRQRRALPSINVKQVASMMAVVAALAAAGYFTYAQYRRMNPPTASTGAPPQTGIDILAGFQGVIPPP